MRLLNPLSFSGVKTLVTALVLASGLSQQAYAEVAQGFYQSQQDVVDQSKSTRERAIKSGFAEILVKLAGDKSIVLRPELNSALQNPKPYLQTYSYIKDEEGDQKVRLEFNGSDIEALFSKNKLPLWSKDRPPLVMWIGIDNGQGRRLISAQDSQTSGFRHILEEEAKARGLSLVWPSIDEQDQKTLSITDVWSLDMNTAVNASRRYDAQFVVIGKVSISPSGDWYGQWGVQHEGRAHWFDGEQSSYTANVSSLIDTVATELGQTYAIEVGHDVQETVIVEIDAVESLRDFADITDILDKLLPVNRVSLKEALPHRLVFMVDVQGGEPQLVSSLRMQPRLRQIPNQETTSYQSMLKPVGQQQPINTQDLESTEEKAGESESIDATVTAMEPSEQESFSMVKYRWVGR